MEIEITIVIKTDDSIFGVDQEEKDWLFQEVLGKPDELFLHSNFIGDTIGEVITVKEVKEIL